MEGVSPNSQRNKMAFLAMLLAAFLALVCNGSALAQDKATPIWPTEGWETSSPEEQGMDSGPEQRNALECPRVT